MIITLIPAVSITNHSPRKDHLRIVGPGVQMLLLLKMRLQSFPDRTVLTAI